MKKLIGLAIFAMAIVGCSAESQHDSAYEATRFAFANTWENMSDTEQNQACMSLKTFGYAEMLEFFTETIPEGEEDNYSPEAVVDYLVEMCE